MGLVSAVGRGWRRWALVLGLAVMAAACGDSDDDAVSNGGKFACLDFVATVTSGPSSGRAWTGDLILNADETGAFTGLLVPVGDADREALEVRNRDRTICRAVGQRNGAQVSWVLYCGNDRIFGTGQVTPVGADQELRGIIQGPTDRDFGVYHGSNRPPYIRIISGDRS